MDTTVEIQTQVALIHSFIHFNKKSIQKLILIHLQRMDEKRINFLNQFIKTIRYEKEFQ
jgi:hypothetical protein